MYAVYTIECCIRNQLKTSEILNTPINTILAFRLHLMVRSIFVTHVTQKLQDKVPCQAVINNMYVDETPVELASLKN